MIIFPGRQGASPFILLGQPIETGQVLMDLQVDLPGVRLVI